MLIYSIVRRNSHQSELNELTRDSNTMSTLADLKRNKSKRQFLGF